MKLSALRLFSNLVFCAVAVVIGAMGWTLYDATARTKESAQWVAHTLEVLQTISDVNDNLDRAQSVALRYLLSSDDAPYLPERELAHAKVEEGIMRLQMLTSDNADQQGRIFRLNELIAARVAIMNDALRRRHNEGIETARAYAVSEIEQQTTSRILDLAQQLANDEWRLLELRRADEQHRNDAVRIKLIVAGLVCAFILIPGYIGFSHLIRARERAERKLLEMTDNLPSVVFQYRLKPDGSARYEFLSLGVERMRGVSRDEALQDPAVIWNSIHDDDKPAFLAALTECQRSLAPMEMDFRLQPRNGTVTWLRSSTTVVKQADGSVVWNGAWTDITAQKSMDYALRHAKEEADSATRAKSIFLSTMSHEIRTPMNGVLGMLELLSLTKLDAEQRTTLEVVRESGKSLQRIIDDILDFSKIEAGKLEVRSEVSSIQEVIENVLNVYRGNASSKGLLLKLSADPRISPAVLVDPLRLRQILSNFISNAIKFTSKGRIEIKAELVERRDGEDRVRFSVSDTGIGIAPEDQKLLFQPFIQAEGDTTRRFGGTGLGLTICQRLADMMGGSIEMVSEPGKGTTMILTLTVPIADPKDLPSAGLENTRDLLSTTITMRRVAPTIAQAEMEGTLVLVADDHPTNRTLVMRQVNTLGYASETAENGIEALNKWKSGRFAIVITDCNMPEMDGYELARSIRNLESENGRKRTPIIACTANALGGEAEICFAAGMDDYLAKPIDLKVLLKKLDQWLPIPAAGAVHAKEPAKRSDALAPGAATPIDRSVLAQATSGDEAAARDILMDFRRANNEDAAKLGQALGKRDSAQATLASHRIKGVSQMVGATGLATVCERLEHASRARDWTTVEANMEAFHRELNRLNAYVDSL